MPHASQVIQLKLFDMPLQSGDIVELHCEHVGFPIAWFIASDGLPILITPDAATVQ